MGAMVAGVIGHYADAIGRRLRLLDFPDLSGGRKQHARVTPLVGGIALVLPTLLACAITANTGHSGGAAVDVHIFWFGATLSVMFLIGLADDRFGLSARLRLALAAAILLLGSAEVFDFQISFLRFTGQDALLPLPGALGLGFTVICLVGFLNAVNMADGKNGLVIGQALIWAMVLLFRLPASMVPILGATSGALAVLLIYNLRGRLFLGDAGSYGLSAIFGLMAIFAWNNGFADMRADDLSLIFALPVLDTLRLIAQRLAQGKTPFTPGRDHLHHYLHARWGWPRPLPWVLALVALPNAAALLWPGTAPLGLLATLAGYVVLLVLARRTAVAARA
jgi:UDP-GlcNAc:undecaprenyl-phosphate/decaprenyl-phosphate GlcNAc-1-phosphate transferase